MCRRTSRATWHIVSSQNDLFTMHLSLSIIRTSMIMRVVDIVFLFKDGTVGGEVSREWT